jgi:hypothetical protein
MYRKCTQKKQKYEHYKLVQLLEENRVCIASQITYKDPMKHLVFTAITLVLDVIIPVFRIVIH